MKEEVDSALRKYIINTKRYDARVFSEINKIANIGCRLLTNFLIISMAILW